MFRLKQDRIYILGSIVILSSVLSTNSGIAASKPTPNPGLAPTPVAAPPAPLESPKSLESQSGIAKTVLDNPVAEVISVMIANHCDFDPYDYSRSGICH